MNRRSLREMAVRVVLLLLGLWIAHLGVTLFLQTNLGSDPFNVFVQGLFRALPWPDWAGMTHGRVHLLVSLLIMVVLLVVDRSYVGIGTVLCMALGGPIIDVYTLWLSPFLNETLPLAVRVPLLAVGCVILAFGMTIVIRSEAGTGPNDLVAERKSRGVCKNRKGAQRQERETLRSGADRGGPHLRPGGLCPGGRGRGRHHHLCLSGGPRRPAVFPCE